ncbi:siderophore-interacting protein [Agromyces rhizosphaerae]|uniref:Siderophore-interacting protein n=1 Tax=Agromyces rhizosphaerae TaxID=88374 RepID=A0A9W6CW04_9MICO|nr:siderophore-interacting protein [Agromyces rhizosphaerae]GLI27081.1 siderophore-interacting protein [Agromyces rhizosphaerae]
MQSSTPSSPIVLDGPVTAFRRERRPLELRFRRARLAERVQVSPGYVRVRLAGHDLRGFESLGPDDHIRVFFPADGVEPESIESYRESPSREYTPLAWDRDAGTLDLEFVLHGDHGVAGRWAADAPIGAPVAVGGPRGSAVFDGAPESWFLAGDETAVPAIRRFLALAGANARGRVLVEVPDAAHELDLDVPDGVRLDWVHRGADPAARTAALIEALDVLGPDHRPAGDLFAFVAAEQSVVKPARALVHDRWGVGPEQSTVKGYWKGGDAAYHAPH